MKKKLQKGFTLVEMLIYMGLLSIFLVVLTEIFVNILDIKAESEATGAVEQDGRYIISRLSNDIEQASAVSVPVALGGSGNTLTMTVGGNTYTYSQNSSNFQLVNNIGTNNLNSTGSVVSGLNFQRIGNSGGKDTIRVFFTLTSATARVGGNEVRNFQTTIGRRM